jgi:putative RecB family exonuclease
MVMIYSHSRLEAFRNCPLSFKFQYIDRIKSEREGVEAFMGSRVHEALEQLYRDWRMCKYTSEDEVVELFNWIWRRDWHDGVAVVKQGYGPGHYRAVGEKAIRAYYRRYHPFDDGATVWLEEKVNVPLDPVGRYRMSGVVDRLVAREGGLYEIHDYKTSQYLPEQSKLDADRQLALYQLAVEAAFPDAREVRLVWHYLVFDKELQSRRAPEDLAELRRSTIDLIEVIEACEEFSPCESNLCAWCSFQQLCPLRKHLCAVEALPPREFAADEGVRLADRYAELKAREKEAAAELSVLKEDVVAYCKQHGVERVRGTDSLLSVRIDRAPRFPGTSDEERASLEEAVRVMGKWDEVSTLNVSRLSQAYRDKTWTEGQLSLLDPFICWEESATINVRKLKAGER